MEIVEYNTCMDALMPLLTEQLADGKHVRFSPNGMSMLPMLRQETDSVVLSPVPNKLKKYDLPLYRRDNGKYILHRIVEAGDTYTCVGDNQFTLEKGIRHDQMIGIVTAFERGCVKHSTDEWQYKLYCRFWHFTRPIRHFWRRGIGVLRRHLK